MLFRSVALSLLVGAATADLAPTHAEILASFDAFLSSPASAVLGVQSRNRRQDECQVDSSLMESAMSPIFPGGQEQMQRFMAGECGQTYLAQMGSVFSNPTASTAETFCASPCLQVTIRYMKAMAAAVPNTDVCASMRMSMSMMPNIITSMMCARNHLNIRCAAVFQSISTLTGDTNSVNSGTSDSAITAGAAPTELYGHTLNATEQEQFGGMCGQFEAAGCCFESAVGMIAGMGNAVTGVNRTQATELVAHIRNASTVVREACTAAGRTLVSNIGAPACQIASVRNGAISSPDGVADAPIARAIRRRLRLMFAGDLSTLSTTQQDALKASITTTIEASLGADTVESVTLSSGSIAADVAFVSTVDPDEISALTTDTSVTQMQPSDGTTTFEQSSSPVTDDTTSDNSGAASITTALGLVLGLIAAVAMV